MTPKKPRPDTPRPQVKRTFIVAKWMNDAVCEYRDKGGASGGVLDLATAYREIIKAGLESEKVKAVLA